MTKFRCTYAKFSYTHMHNIVYYLKDVSQVGDGFTAKKWTFTQTGNKHVHPHPGFGGLFDFDNMHMFQIIAKLPTRVKKVIG